jgi:hypothetical protein
MPYIPQQTVLLPGGADQGLGDPDQFIRSLPDTFWGM